MTIRNFDRLFAPASVALIGARAQAGTVGRIVAENLLTSGFRGPVWLVNPHHLYIAGTPCFADVAALPGVPDLAIIATPPPTIPGVVSELAAKGTRGAVVLTAGIHGELRKRMLEAAQPATLRIQGPNCLGLMLPRIGLNASFAQRAPLVGDLAFISQSGALVTAIVDWAASRGIGFSHVVSVGDMADVDFGDLLDYLAGDVSSRAILIYMEAVTHAPKFMSAARRAARAKPVIVLKAGRQATGQRAAFSHTGALAGADQAYAAAFRRAGLLRVNELEDLFRAAEVLARIGRLDGDRLAILTNGGGAGVLAADRLADLGGTLAALAPATLASLDASLPQTWSHANPVDVIGDADPTRFGAALHALLEDGNTDAVLALHCPTALASSDAMAARLSEEIAGRRSQGKTTKPILTCWLGDEAAQPARRRFSEAGLATFETPSTAVDGFMQLVCYAQAQDALLQTPPAQSAGFQPDTAIARNVIASALATGRTRLDEVEGKTLLRAYSIPVARTLLAKDASEAGVMAGDILRTYNACVLKIVSDELPHKSDVGGVRLSLRRSQDVVQAGAEMLQQIRASHPQARITGLAVEPMIDRPLAQELMVGMTDDATFGPMLMFGAGGVAVEVLADTAMALPPLDMKLARDLIGQTRVARLLAGYRDRPAADLEALALAIVRLGMLIAAHPEIRELDINPLLADAQGVIALDVRVRLGGPDEPPRKPLAIRPYPTAWAAVLEVEGYGRVPVRPIRPEDERLYEPFLQRVAPEDLRQRFFSSVRQLSHKFVARLTQIDYAREMAFIALSVDQREMLAAVRLHADPDYLRAEFAVIVRTDLQGHGLGWQLMRHLIDYARAEGLQELYGTVLATNDAMLRMCRELGFEVRTDASDRSTFSVRLPLVAGMPQPT